MRIITKIVVRTIILLSKIGLSEGIRNGAKQVDLVNQKDIDSVNSIISGIESGLRRGISEKKLQQEILCEYGKKNKRVITNKRIIANKRMATDIFQELLSIARARIRNQREKRIIAAPLFMNESDLRFATSSVIAKYRADKLAVPEGTLVEIGCGVGLQSIFFAKTCKRVIAIDSDVRKIEYAKANAALFNIKNIEFVCADGISAAKDIAKKIRKQEHGSVFCDPSRPAQEEIRSISSLSPSIPDLLDAYSKARQFCIELPPRIDIQKAARLVLKSTYKSMRPCAEFISVNGVLSRLDMNLRNYARPETMATAIKNAGLLAAAHQLFNSPDSVNYTAASINYGMAAEKVEKRTIAKNDNGSYDIYLYEVDSGIVRAGLLGQLIYSEKCLGNQLFLYSQGRHCFLASDSLVRNAFLSSSYRVLDVVEECGKNHHKNFLSCSACLNKINSFLRFKAAGKAVLRANVASSEYWKIRSKLEAGLSGSKTFYVIVLDKVFVCEKVGQ